MKYGSRRTALNPTDGTGAGDHGPQPRYDGDYARRELWRIPLNWVPKV